MSYSVSISRRADPLDEEGPAITSDEWLDAVAREADFRVPEASETEWAGPFMRVWTGHPDGPVHFDWMDGAIDVKNPDPPMIVRMKALAATLGATVFSETGAVFDDDGEEAGFLDGYP
jgi:hypothetical protein